MTYDVTCPNCGFMFLVSGNIPKHTRCDECDTEFSVTNNGYKVKLRKEER